MPPKLLDHRGNPMPPTRSASGPLRVLGRYDAAQNSTESANHWANADALSSRAANDPGTRLTLRKRARYERDNNSYASGIVETLANDCIGTGPRVQFLSADPDANKAATLAFERWSCAVGLAETLRTYREARAVDGEGFLLLTSNPGLSTPVQLDLKALEADQVASPTLFVPTATEVDGIEFDGHGNPSMYHVLRQHPGDAYWYNTTPWEYDRVPASLVLHWFKRRRPGQARGVPEITPALPLFALLRRYTLATVSAAEMAALFAVLCKTTMPPDDETAPVAPFDAQDLMRGMIAALPEGYEAQQMKPEHPTTTYDVFKNALLCEIARCLHMPFNVAAGNSSSYNYSSGRLDHQGYHRAIGVDRYFLETHVLDRILAAWLAESRMADPGPVAGLPSAPGQLPRHMWFWDGFSHVDPEKEANAVTMRLANGTTSLALECAEEGLDWREVADQQAEERAYFADRGIPYPGDTPPPAAPPESPPPPPANGRRRPLPLNGAAHHG